MNTENVKKKGKEPFILALLLNYMVKHVHNLLYGLNASAFLTTEKDIKQLN